MNPWPADRVERRAVASLVPYARNARTHSDAQVKQIAASMREWGVTNPILIAEDSTIIAGHARVMAAQSLGIDELPVMIASGWSDEQKRAYVLADNQLALNGGWNSELLSIELKELKGLGADLSLIGFGSAELERLTGNVVEGLTDPDAVPEAGNVLGVKAGDLWRLGDHRLACGDNTNAAVVAASLDGSTPHLMVTDPPYGVNYDPTWRKGSEKRTYLGGDPDLESVWQETWQQFSGDVVYIWHAHSKTKDLWIALEKLHFVIRQPIIWNKMRFIIGRGDYSFNHEACFYGVRSGGQSHWQGARDQPTVWDILHRASDTNHGAQKPIECMHRPIINNSAQGDHVYDPFVGSGTTIIAAEMTGRICHAIEIDPAYCDIAIRRWQEFTGKEATRCEAGSPDRPTSKSSTETQGTARSTKASRSPKSKSHKSPTTSPPMRASNGSASPASSPSSSS